MCEYFNTGLDPRCIRSMEICRLPCKRRRIQGKTSERVLLDRNSDSDSDESASSLHIIRTIIRRKSRVRAESLCLCHDVYVRMKKNNLPYALFNMIWWIIYRGSGSSTQNLDHVEWFAGVSNIHKAMLELGLRSVAVDIKKDPIHHNYTEKRGILYAVQITRRLRRRGGQHLATVCSSWIWANRETSKRYESLPLGVAPWSPNVANANQMVSLCAMMWLWCWCAGCSTILEQPLGSLMGLHPRILQLKRVIGSFVHVTTHMGAFGGDCPKPTNLYSDSSYVHKLVRSPTQADRARFAELDREIMTRCPITGALSGGRDMKASQAYPVEYGRVVAASYKTHIDKTPEELPDSETSSEEDCMADRDSWADAGVCEVCDWLGVPSNRFCDL